jgi:hypothetical protein
MWQSRPHRSCARGLRGQGQPVRPCPRWTRLGLTRNRICIPGNRRCLQSRKAGDLLNTIGFDGCRGCQPMSGGSRRESYGSTVQVGDADVGKASSPCWRPGGRCRSDWRVSWATPSVPLLASRRPSARQAISTCSAGTDLVVPLGVGDSTHCDHGARTDHCRSRCTGHRGLPVTDIQITDHTQLPHPRSTAPDSPQPMTPMDRTARSAMLINRGGAQRRGNF